MGRIADLIRWLVAPSPSATLIGSQLPSEVWSWSDFQVEIDPGAWERLTAKLRATQWAKPIVVDGISLWCLDGGIGPATYISPDGRIAVVHEASVPVSMIDAHRAIAVAARRSGVDEFLELQPPRPSEAETCNVCSGRRFAPMFGAADENEASFVCSTCDGLGWVLRADGTD